MEPAQIFAIFIVLLLVEEIFEIVLVFLNVKHAESGNLPPQLEGLYDSETSKKALKYTTSKAYFGIFSSLYSLFLILLLLFNDFFAKFDFWLKSYHLSAPIHGMIYLLSLMLGMSLLQIPLSYYSSFILEEKFGFNKTTKLLWIKDQITSLFLSTIILAPIIYLLLYFMADLGGAWWVFAAFSVILVQLVLAFVFPIWIAPLFNKFTELQDEKLKEEIVDLVSRVGYKATGIYSVDGSKRSSHANAYFAGIGRSKRIVLYDTLLNLLNTKEILSVLAHEIGHETLGHIKKSILFSSLMIFSSFFILNYFYTSSAFYHAFGFEAQSNHAALLIFSLISGPFLFFMNPVFNLLSRCYEFQADNFAVNATKGSAELISALVALSKNSLSNLNPHPWYSFMHYSHPTLSERIRAMQETITSEHAEESKLTPL